MQEGVGRLTCHHYNSYFVCKNPWQRCLWSGCCRRDSPTSWTLKIGPVQNSYWISCTIVIVGSDPPMPKSGRALRVSLRTAHDQSHRCPGNWSMAKLCKMNGRPLQRHSLASLVSFSPSRGRVLPTLKSHFLFSPQNRFDLRLDNLCGIASSTEKRSLISW